MLTVCGTAGKRFAIFFLATVCEDDVECAALMLGGSTYTVVRFPWGLVNHDSLEFLYSDYAAFHFML